MTIKAEGNILLEIVSEAHAEPILAMVNAGRPHLREWLNWVDKMQTVKHFQHFIRDAKKRHADNTDHAYVIITEKGMAGRIGIYNIDHQNKTASIGYWLAKGFEGSGIMTRSCAAVVDHCFGALQLNRIEIRCGTGNHKSRAIPERLRFTREGILRQGERVNGAFIDLYVYSMLKQEWQAPVSFLP